MAELHIAQAVFLSPALTANLFLVSACLGRVFDLVVSVLGPVASTWYAYVNFVGAHSVRDA